MRIFAAALAVSALAADDRLRCDRPTDMEAVLGKALFERDWVPAPASTDSADGLGPLFCRAGLLRLPRRPALAARFTDAPEGRVAGRGLVVRFGDAEGQPDPLYGALLQNQAVQGMQPEGRIVLTRRRSRSGALDVAVTLDRGAARSGDAPVGAHRAAASRAAPCSTGSTPTAVLALADPDDRDGDGISGRARMLDVDGTPTLGRYGWKAGATGARGADRRRLRHRPRPVERAPPVPAWRLHGSARATAWPRRPARASRIRGPRDFRRDDRGRRRLCRKPAAAEARRGTPSAGSELFAATGCAACHAPAMPARDGGSVAAYTDLLLHDMGPALDDGVGEPGVASAEWRTAPLIAMSGGDGPALSARRPRADARRGDPRAWRRGGERARRAISR